MRYLILIAALCAALASGTRAEVEELLSPNVQVLRPRGEFASLLIRALPAEGGGWRSVEIPGQGIRLSVPAGAQVDTEAADSRMLLAELDPQAPRPQPRLRIDVFQPAPDDPTDIDLKYAQLYAERYPDEAFDGKFVVQDSGMITMKKLNYAMVGGLYTQGAAQAYRLQWEFLAKDRQVLLTFDCAAGQWERYAPQLARMVLTFQPAPPKKK